MHILKVGCKNEVDFIREMTHSYGKIMSSQSPEKDWSWRKNSSGIKELALESMRVK